jgi:hypothetical protein
MKIVFSLITILSLLLPKTAMAAEEVFDISVEGAQLAEEVGSVSQGFPFSTLVLIGLIIIALGIKYRPDLAHRLILKIFKRK